MDQTIEGLQKQIAALEARVAALEAITRIDDGAVVALRSHTSGGAYVTMPEPIGRVEAAGFGDCHLFTIELQQ